MDLLQYAFFQNALIGSLLTAIACGIVGTYIVSRRLVFISGGITHASFGGLGLGFYLGTNPILMAMLFSILSAFGVEWASKTQNVREDSAESIARFAGNLPEGEPIDPQLVKETRVEEMLSELLSMISRQLSLRST